MTRSAFGRQTDGKDEKGLFMLFNSFEFLVFLPVVFLLYWFVFRPRHLQNLLIVVASYVFYGWWDWRFLLLIALTSFFSYGSGLLLEHYEGNRRVQRAVSASNIVLNLAILGVFKYYNFFVENLDALFGAFGYHLDWVTMNVILPVGISFYTFQALSYTIDVYRGKLKAANDIVSFFAFISFFPQLVAGPIERATNLLPQFQKSRSFDYVTAVDGTKQILWGMFKKVVIADNCADVVDKIWLDYSSHSSVMLLIAALLFSFQIYGDFSGYSDIAIGTGKLFGIRLMRNFNLPYFSRSIAEFWKRWHISLNTWFVDYVYIPLGGSREGQWKMLRNTFVIFFLSGLWHGANWTYVTWGTYHAALFIPFILIGKRSRYTDIVAHNSNFPSFKELCQILITFVLSTFGWVIFRANNISDFAGYILSFATNFDIHEDIEGKKPLFFIAILLCVEWINRKREHTFAFQIPNQRLRWGIYILTAFLCLTQAGKQVQFIYFQF